jgi:hypothetical protein
VSSTAPTWRDASLLLVALSGLYLVLVALISYGVGGYVAGRMRVRLSGGTPDEIEFRDGVHGAAAWALDTLRRYNCGDLETTVSGDDALCGLASRRWNATAGLGLRIGERQKYRDFSF